MEYYRRNYGLEVLVVLAGLSVSTGLYALFGYVLYANKEALSYVAIANAGLLFVIGHVYSRLKDRRDSKRKRAQELFLEWHSKDIRDSRIYVSRWRRVNSGASLPSLSAVEESAATAVADAYAAATAPNAGQSRTPMHPLNDPEQLELHCFRIYQFFERWSLLVQRADIDHRLASEYMSSYKDWYLNGFIRPWLSIESDEYIKASLERIVDHVAPSHGQHDG